jgi:GR25 family glycosyltransferase involved in LPS biosynthesis
MEAELTRVGLSAIRHRGMLPQEYKGDFSKVAVMHKAGKGSIGCHYSQVGVMETALSFNRSAMVLEDDLVICSDIKLRLNHAEKFLNEHNWDVFWLGGTYHLEPRWHAKEHPQLPQCGCKLGKDWEPTEDKKIVRTYGEWSTYAYIVNIDSLPKVLKMLEENVHLSIGIDWLFILLQPLLYCYAFVPGCIKQYDNQSSIGTGITKFSGFHVLGAHWWSDYMTDV